jgi:hypothetical protein
VTTGKFPHINERFNVSLTGRDNNMAFLGYGIALMLMLIIPVKTVVLDDD